MFLKTELDDAISICYKYLFENQDNNEIKKPTIFDILSNIKNEGSPYIHYYPYNLILQLTSNCNLRCKHCFFCGNTKAYSPEDDLTEEEMLRHLRYLVEEVNILYCSITGGEIFTSNYIFKILEYLKSKNIVIELLTNATLITEKTAERLSKLLNHKTDTIQVSLEGATKDINDEMRGEGVFKKVTQSVKFLTERDLTVLLSYTINSKNSNQLSDMYDLCKTLKISQLNIGRFQLFNLSQKYLEPKSDEIFINIAKLIQKFQKDKTVKIKTRCLKTFDFLNYDTGIRLLNEKLDNETFDIPQNLSCRPRHDQFTLFANGDISLCYNCDIEDLCIGNLKEKSFDEIWANRFSKSIFQERKIENVICKDCKYVPLCSGGCPLNAYYKYKTLDAPDGYCKYSEKLYIERGK